ncbi:hypothetical protein [Niveispirillum irakense]|uniref:hypothetical protein n=1 Tax=Niveispirillum irakense TaxID=34011 RepID=UPI000420F4AF|nr:hypothetical protein [Niveispirillum irakense]
MIMVTEKISFPVARLGVATVPPSRRVTILAGLAGQIQSVLAELLAGETHRYGLSPHLRRDIGWRD